VSTTTKFASFVFLTLTTAQGVAQSQSATAGPINILSVCPNVSEAFAAAAFPREAVKQRLREGEVVVAFTVTSTNQIENVEAVEATHPVFAEAAIATVKRLGCNSGGKELRLRIPFGYKFEGSFTPSPS